VIYRWFERHPFTIPVAMATVVVFCTIMSSLQGKQPPNPATELHACKEVLNDTQRLLTQRSNEIAQCVDDYETLAARCQGR